MVNDQEQEVVDFQIENTLHEPRLLSPKDGSVISRSREILLRWGTVVTATKYTVQVSHDSFFVNPEYSAVVDTTATRTTTLQHVLYYWRVRARNDRLESPWSEMRRFNISLE